MSPTTDKRWEQPLLKVTGAARRGKTAALVRRAADLIERGENPAGILIAAPTAIACDRLAERLATALPADLAGRARAVTIARPLDLCTAVLEEGRAAGLTDRFGRVLPEEEYRLVVEDLKTLGQKNQRLHAMLAFFFAQWSDLEPEGEWVIAGEESTVLSLLRELLGLYRGSLRDEVPALAARLLQSEAGAALGQRFPFVLCDDFQDLSRAEQTALSLLASRQLVVAGDETQVVKAGTAYPCPRGFADFERVRRGVTVIDLDAEEAASPRPPQTITLAWDTPDEEMAHLAEMVQAAARATASPLGAGVVAVPTRFWGRAAVRALAQAGLAVDDGGLGRSLGGDPRVPGRHRALSAYAALLLVADPSDPLAWRLWGSFDHALTHSDLWLAVRRRAEKTGETLPQALASLARTPHAPHAEAARAIAKSGRALIERCRNLTGPALLEAVGAPAALIALAGPLDEGDDAQALRDRVRDGLLNPRFSDDAGAVRVALYESTVGLDGAWVVLPGLVNGLVPHRDAFDIVKGPEVRAALMDTDEARLRTAASQGVLRVGSTFARAEVEIAEQAKMRVERIASQKGRRVALLSASTALAACGLDGEPVRGADALAAGLPAAR